MSKKPPLSDIDKLKSKKNVENLGKLGDAKAVKALIPILKDEDEFVRLAAVESLVDIGDLTALESIKRVIKNEKVAYIQQAMKSELKKLR